MIADEEQVKTLALSKWSDLSVACGHARQPS
jgi:hypothetical protein